MKNIIKSYIKGFGLTLVMVASSAHAIPTLFFDGTINYDSTTGRLTVSSILIDTFDINPAPSLTGSLNFETQLIDDFAGFGLVIGAFGTVEGQDDIQVLDASSAELLTGNFSDLTMSGDDGSDNGTITGMLNSTGGSLESLFGIGNLIALEFNLSSIFNATMFDTNFSGHIDGRIQGESVAVPEPTALVLLSLGVLLVGFANRRLEPINSAKSDKHTKYKVL